LVNCDRVDRVNVLPPSPRNYPDGVTVIKRSARGPGCAPAESSYAEIEHWLLYDAGGERELLLTYEAFLWRMVAAGLPLDRASLHIGTLHPQLLGFAWNWRRSDATCDEVKVRHFTADTDAYKLNPLSRIFQSGEPLRRQPQRPEAQAEFPIMRELAEAGYTEYLALPLGGERFRHAVTFATISAHGFADEQIEQTKRLLRLFTLHVERHIAVRIAANTLNAYLGPVAAGKVLSGEINRGRGQSIRAMIWVSDLRGFTDLSGRLSGDDMIALLNAYFECFAGAVLAHGGEVLKFMGDGLLAVFPLGDGDHARVAARAALAAAEQALAGLQAINRAAPSPLDRIAGWAPLRAGIALHAGEVFFGNIGAPERLDFTVIGPAVNEASRVEALQKSIGRSILITGAAAELIDAPLDFVGDHALRGVAEPVAIYSPAQAAD
jgi:adenylate cyclase